MLFTELALRAAFEMPPLEVGGRSKKQEISKGGNNHFVINPSDQSRGDQTFGE
jgi:hypothetical protein